MVVVGYFHLGKMTLKSILDDLNDFPIFGGIMPEALAPMEDLFLSGSYEEGEHLIDQGTRGDRLYVMVEGIADVTADLGGQGELQLAKLKRGETFGEMELKRGETFGEMELIDTQDRSATVIAVEPTKTLELTNMKFLKLFNRDPEVFRIMMMNLARDLSRRLRAADRRMAEYIETGQLPPGRNVS